MYRMRSLHNLEVLDWTIFMASITRTENTISLKVRHSYIWPRPIRIQGRPVAKECSHCKPQHLLKPIVPGSIRFRRTNQLCDTNGLCPRITARNKDQGFECSELRDLFREFFFIYIFPRVHVSNAKWCTVCRSAGDKDCLKLCSNVYNASSEFRNGRNSPRLSLSPATWSRSFWGWK